MTTPDQSNTDYDASWQDAAEGKPQTLPFDAFDALGTRLASEFAEAERLRYEPEQRWLTDLRQYRGQYEPKVAETLEGRSSAFKRLTATKVDTLTALMLDLLFPNGKERNFSVTASAKPELPDFKLKALRDALEQAANGNALPKDVIQQAIREAAGNAAMKMADVCDDQLSETRYRRSAKRVLFSGHLYGTGVMKGPLAARETSVSFVWDADKKKYIEKIEAHTRPEYTQVPLWRFYPDMEATEIDDCRYVWEHHRLTKAALLDLANGRGFNKQAIVAYAEANKDGRADQRTYEAELRVIGDKQSATLQNAGLYDLFERYGWIDAAELAQCGAEVPADRLHEAVFANIWVLPGGQVIRVQLLRPGSTYPYYLYQFREDETNIFAEGIAAVMRDDQDMTNAATRAALDNAAITAGPQFVFNTQNLAPNSDYTSIYPFKAWLQTKGDDQYSPVKAVELPNYTQPLLKLAEYFQNSADETTMIPRYMAGDNATQGAAATMGGLSMLLGQGKISIKSLAVNFDEGITRPALTALVAWNMLYHPDPDIKGDYVVVARGASSLVAKEVRAQQAMQFTAGLSPEERKYVKFLPLLREKAVAAEFQDIVMSDQEAKAVDENPQAQQAQQLQQMMQQLAIAKGQAEVANLNAEAARKQMDAMLSKARATEVFVKSLYEAIQGAGIAIQNPHIAAAADEIARSAGFVDQTPQTAIPSGQGQAIQPGPTSPVPPSMPSPSAGSAAPVVPDAAAGVGRGIETPAIGAAQ